MIYVMSDLHGCYDKFLQMLEKIKFNNDDTLYILGDIIDRGDNGIKILLDIMKRSNVFPLLGNHEYMAYNVLKKFNVEITAENYAKQLDSESLQMLEKWMFNGGITTCQEFSKLYRDTRDCILKYLDEFMLYETLKVNGNEFVLVHGGLVDFDKNKTLDEYSTHDIIWGRCDYARTYYSHKYLIIGHTPTNLIEPESKGRIYKRNNHIAIDCGAVYGNNLGCICLDNLQEFYVK